MSHILWNLLLPACRGGEQLHGRAEIKKSRGDHSTLYFSLRGGNYEKGLFIWKIQHNEVIQGGKADMGLSVNTEHTLKP